MEDGLCYAHVLCSRKGTRTSCQTKRPLASEKMAKDAEITTLAYLTVPTLDSTVPFDIIAEAPMKTFVTSCTSEIKIVSH